MTEQNKVEVMLYKQNERLTLGQGNETCLHLQIINCKLNIDNFTFLL